MSFLKNKHMVLAAILAPILGVMSYVAIDAWVSEQPQAAQAGQSYMLVEKPNCRYSSGRCGLKNADFELELSFDRLGGNRLLLKLESAFPLDGVLLAQQVNDNDESKPRPMRAASPDGLNWDLEIRNPDPGNQRLRLVASADSAFYIGDAALKFTISEEDE